jgi:glycolate oxidase iron-sulfur subunit
MTTCPSGANSMHLVDGARTYIEKTYRRPLGDRLFRALLGAVLPYPKRFRLAVTAAALASPFQNLYPRFGLSGQRLAAMMRLAPKQFTARLAVLQKSRARCRIKPCLRSAAPSSPG